MAEINILMKLKNILGAVINPATEETLAAGRAFVATDPGIELCGNPHLLSLTGYNVQNNSGTVLFNASIALVADSNNPRGPNVIALTQGNTNATARCTLAGPFFRVTPGETIVASMARTALLAGGTATQPSINFWLESGAFLSSVGNAQNTNLRENWHGDALTPVVVPATAYYAQVVTSVYPYTGLGGATVVAKFSGFSCRRVVAAPASLAQKASAASLPVVLSSEQEALLGNNADFPLTGSLASAAVVNLATQPYPMVVLSVSPTSGSDLDLTIFDPNTGAAPPFVYMRQPTLGWSVAQMNVTGTGARIVAKHYGDQVQFAIPILHQGSLRVTNTGPSTFNYSLQGFRKPPDLTALMVATLFKSNDMLSHEMGGNPNPVFRENAAGYTTSVATAGVSPGLAVTRTINATTGLPELQLASTVTTTASATVRIDTDPIGIAGGARVKAAARVTRGGFSVSDARITTEFRDGAGVFISNGLGPVTAVSGSNVPYTISADVVAPANAATVRLRVECAVAAGVTPAVLLNLQEFRYWIDGVEQRLDEISAKLPATLGQKSSALSLATVLSTEQEAMLASGGDYNDTVQDPGVLTTGQTVSLSSAWRYGGLFVVAQSASGDASYVIEESNNNANWSVLGGVVGAENTFRDWRTFVPETIPVPSGSRSYAVFEIASRFVRLRVVSAPGAFNVTLHPKRQPPNIGRDTLRNNVAASLLDMLPSSTAQKTMRLERHGANEQFSYNVRAPQPTAVDVASHEVLRQRRIGPSANLTATYSRSGTTVTVTTPSAHNFETGDIAYHSGATDTGLNGYAKVTVTGALTYTFQTASTGTATGSITTKTMGDEFRYRSGVALTGLESGW